MAGNPHCGEPGPGGLECNRIADHDGKHTTYTRVKGDLTAVQWYKCNVIGDPSEVSADGS